MPDQGGEISSQAPAISSATFSAPAETIEMNKYHLQLAYKKVMDRPRAPNIELVFTPLVFAVGLLLTLLPADFKTYWGIAASTWQALVILMVLLGLLAFFALLLRWAFCVWKFPQMSEEQFYEEICKQMEADKEKLASLQHQYPRV